MADPVASVFNDAYIAEQFENYRRDPGSVDESWRQFFRLAAEFGGGTAAASPGEPDQDFARRVVGVSRYLNSIRRYGYLAVQLDPLGFAAAGRRRAHARALRHHRSRPLARHRRGAWISAPRNGPRRRRTSQIPLHAEISRSSSCTAAPKKSASGFARCLRRSS